ncbi:TolC family protein [bacterium]|nr:TolC family protein [bacterium]
MRHYFVFGLCVFQSMLLFGQAAVLDEYLHIALKQNLALQEKTFSLQQSIAALKEARGMFLPSVSLEARYSRAGGGREISIPVGDLMNPVYKALNQLYAESGKTAGFPENIPNVSEPFLREKEHETKIRFIQPVFQPGIYHNYKIKQDLLDIERASRNIYARHLVADVKTAYFNYLKAGQIVTLFKETELLLQENLRISQSLFENEKVTQAVVYRAEAELHAFHQQQANAEKNRDLSRSYFNFLLNRPLDTSIIKSNTIEGAGRQFLTPEEAEYQAIIRREELLQLNKAIEIADHQTGLARSGFLPGITAVLDYGYQGEDYKFGPQDDYWMANLVASWNLFHGFQDKYKIDQEKYQKKQRQIQLEALKTQIQLQVRETCHNLQVALKNIEAAHARKKAAKKSFLIVKRQFQEGMASHIEFIDARNTQTQADVNAIVAQYDYCIQLAEYEKITADYPINKMDKE